MKTITKQKLLVTVACLYCGCLVVSNIIANKTFAFFDWQLPCAVVIFPLVYIINDVLTEIYGFTYARRVVFTGFAINLIAVLAFAATIALPASQFFTEQSSFENVLGSTPRLLLASLSAYLVGSLMNAKIMEIGRKKLPKFLMARCIGSTLVGETLDATLFITIAFAGTMPTETLLQMVILQAGFKTLYEVIIYPLTRVCITRARQLPDA